MPVPNPAPGPIDVRGNNDPPGLDEQPPSTSSTARSPGLVRRATRSSNRPSETGVRVATGHLDRSTTSSPKVIEHKDLKQGASGSSKPGQAGGPGHRRHLSRVEKIAAVIQHVTSLPFLADSPVETYYPPKDKEVVAPTEPFHAFDPSVPKRYRPPPPMPPCWYQPKSKKPKKPKKSKKPKMIEPTKAVVKTEVDPRGFAIGDSDEEFEYPDYDDYLYEEYMHGGYSVDTPTLQSDQPTEDSDTLYEHPRTIQDVGLADYSRRPAYFPGPIKSTGLTTPRYPDVYPVGHRPLQIMPPPSPGHEGSGSSSGSSYEPIPSPLTTAYDPVVSQYVRTPVVVPTDVPPSESQSAATPVGPPLIISSPKDAPKGILITSSGNKFGSLPGGYSPQPYSKHYEPAFVPPKGKKSSPRAYEPSPRAYAPTPKGYAPTPKGYAPTPKGYGPSPQALYGPPPQALFGPPPQEPYGPPSQELYGSLPRGHGPSPQSIKPSSKDFGPSPKVPLGKPPKVPSGFSPPTPYGPSPQFPYELPPPGPYGPSPQALYGIPPQGYPSYPVAFYAETPQYVWSWGAPPYAGAPGQIPPPPPIPGESPPPIPSPIATSTARSRSSRHK